MDKKYKIYKYTFPNGKVYIGQTSLTIKQRQRSKTGYKSCTLVGRAFEKYGWDNVILDILYDNLSYEDANILEIQCIKKYNATDVKYGYNIREGGYNTPIAESTKKTLSEKSKQWYKLHPISQEKKDKMSKMAMGRKLSKEACINISKSKMGKNNPNWGKKMSSKTIEKMRTAHKGKKFSDIHRLNISKKISRQWDDLEFREYISQINMGHTITENGKRRISESKKGNKIWLGRKHLAISKQKMSEHSRNIKAVKCIETNKVYRSCIDCAKDNKISPSSLNNVLSGRTTTSGGKHFEYKKTKN